jgi:ubiquinone/menaquinone biosynthesis C-methylase UbiE
MFHRFSQRSDKLERLDTGDYTPQEHARWLREMRFIHRIFGEINALRGTLMRHLSAVDSHTVSILDVGAGSGHLLRSVHKLLGTRTSFLVAAELNTQAAASIAQMSKNGEIQVLQCDGLELPFADDSFDYVYCSLFLHHLVDSKAIELLREMNRVARRRIFVVDLHRSPIGYYFFRAFSRLLFQRFTCEDGALSILRSFVPHELSQLAADAGLADVNVSRSWAYRLVLSGNKLDG